MENNLICALVWHFAAQYKDEVYALLKTDILTRHFSRNPEENVSNHRKQVFWYVTAKDT